jgi:hypothetical protein
MTKLKEIKIPKDEKSLKQFKEEVDVLLAQLIKDYDRIARRPIEFESVNKYLHN